MAHKGTFRAWLLGVMLLSSCAGPLLTKTSPDREERNDNTLRMVFPVYFSTEEKILPPQELLVLDKLAQVMQLLPSVTTEITSDLHSPQAQSRAVYVQEYLVSRGIAGSRVQLGEKASSFAAEKDGRVDVVLHFMAEGTVPPAPAGHPLENDAHGGGRAENDSFTERGGFPEYKIGPGDRLAMTFNSVAIEEKYLLTVKGDGTVSLPFGKPVMVAGRTPREVAEFLPRELSGLYKRLWVDVAVEEFHSKRVTVLGAVGQPGVYPLRGKTSLVEVLALAGASSAGATRKSDFRRITVRRSDGDLATIDASPRGISSRANGDYLLDTGDLVFVPEEPEVVERVSVLGEVKVPGVYPVTPHMTVVEAVAKAGGYTDGAKPGNSVVLRGNLHNPNIIPVNLSDALSGEKFSDPTYVQNEDIVFVPKSIMGSWNAFINQIKPTMEMLQLPANLLVDLVILRQL